MAATASSTALQQQVEELQACCPVLCPDIIPSGYDTQDLIGLMQQAGRERVEEFETLLTEAGRGVSSCCICGADGHPSTSGASEDADSDGDEEDDDESELHFTVLTGLDFSNRSVVLKRAGFACRQCRALRSTQRMVRFAAARVGVGSQADSHSELLLRLSAHLAAANQAPDELQGSPQALAVWVQELYSRAYALQVVASNLAGWKVVGADGQPVSLAKAKDVVAAARRLLEPPKAKKQKQHKEQKQGAATSGVGKQAGGKAGSSATQGDGRGPKQQQQGKGKGRDLEEEEEDARPTPGAGKAAASTPKSTPGTSKKRPAPGAAAGATEAADAVGGAGTGAKAKGKAAHGGAAGATPQGGKGAADAGASGEASGRKKARKGQQGAVSGGGSGDGGEDVPQLVELVAPSPKAGTGPGAGAGAVKKKAVGAGAGAAAVGSKGQKAGKAGGGQADARPAKKSKGAQ